jgi:hypothetical protein
MSALARVAWPRYALCLALLAAAAPVVAQDLLIRNATVHTAAAAGTLREADVLVQGGVVRAVGKDLAAVAGVPEFEARGAALTPALFGGFSGIGIEEVSADEPSVDNGLALGGEAAPAQTRPEFDVSLAYNPRSSLVPVARVGGIGYTVLAANSAEGGSLIAGQGGLLRLDGRSDQPLGQRVLFVSLGGGAEGLSGGSRAAQWMLLEQAIREARGLHPYDAPHTLLTPAGREVLLRFLAGNGRIVFRVERAADIRQLLRFAQRHGIRPVIAGGAEAWMLAGELAAANVPVFVDPLANLPESFDELGSRLDNAALLARAGVRVGFLQGDDASHNARKLRQSAGNAVANGLPWEQALAAITRVPAETFGVGAELGSIEVGRRADLVLWSGDPLEVSSLATRLWMDGRELPLVSRQTELRDRYLHRGDAH